MRRLRDDRRLVVGEHQGRHTGVVYQRLVQVCLQHRRGQLGVGEHRTLHIVVTVRIGSKRGILAHVHLRLLAVLRRHGLQRHSGRIHRAVVDCLHDNVLAGIEERVLEVYRYLTSVRCLLERKRRVPHHLHIVLRVRHHILVGHRVVGRRIPHLQLEQRTRLRLHVGSQRQRHRRDGTGAIARTPQRSRVNHPFAPRVGIRAEGEAALRAVDIVAHRHRVPYLLLTTHTPVVNHRTRRLGKRGLVVVVRRILHHAVEMHHRVIAVERYARRIALVHIVLVGVVGHIANVRHRQPRHRRVAAHTVHQVHRIVQDTLRHIGPRVEHHPRAAAARMVNAVRIKHHVYPRRYHLEAAGAHTHIVQPPASAGHIAGQKPPVQHKLEYQLALVVGHIGKEVVKVETFVFPLGVVYRTVAPLVVRVDVERRRAHKLRAVVLTVRIVVHLAGQLLITVVRLVGYLHPDKGDVVVTSRVGSHIADVVKLQRNVAQAQILGEIYRVRQHHDILGLRLHKLHRPLAADIQGGVIHHPRRRRHIVVHRRPCLEPLLEHEVDLSTRSEAKNRKNHTKNKKPGLHILLFLFFINQLLTRVYTAHNAPFRAHFCRYKYTQKKGHTSHFYIKKI